MLTVQEIEAAHANSQPIQQTDVVYARMEFPLKKRFYPLGFPLDISTNSVEILEAAEESWGDFTELFQTVPLRVQIGVLEGDSFQCPPASECRVQQHIFSFVADRENFGIYDMYGGFTSIWLTRQAVKYRSYIRYFFLQAAAMCQIGTQYATGVHAGCVERNGIGIMLCGDSGAGKSTLSYACAKAGWTYISDDGSYLVHDHGDRLVVGNCHQVRFRPATGSIFPEIQGREITQRSEVGKPSIELNPLELGNIRCSQTAKVEYVVFLNRHLGENETLRPYSKDVARHFMCQGRFTPPDMMLPHYEAIDNLLRAEVLELRYRDIDWAIEQLETLV